MNVTYRVASFKFLLFLSKLSKVDFAGLLFPRQLLAFLATALGDGVNLHEPVNADKSTIPLGTSAQTPLNKLLN